MNRAQDASTASLGPTLVAVAVSFALFAGTIIGWLWLDRSPAARTGVMLLILVNATVMLGAMALEMGRRPYSLHLMHLLALFLFLGASSLFQYSRGIFGVAGPIAAVGGQILPAVIAVSLWLVGYLAGYVGQNRISSGVHGPMVRFLERPLAPLRTGIVLGLAVISLLYLAATGLAGAATRGAVLESMASYALESGAGAYTSVWYMVNLLLIRSFSLVALMGGLLVFWRDRSSRNPIFLGLLGATLLGVLVVNNPFAAARMWLAITVIAFAAPFVLRRRKTGALLVAIALGGIAFLPALHESRYALSFDEWWMFFQLVSPLDYLSTNSDVDSLGMLALCQRWTESQGHRFGMQMLGAALFWVPRTIWASKPIETGAMVTEDLGFEFTNLAPPIMSDPLVDFGLIGIPVIAALFGMLLSRLDAIYWHGRGASSDSLRVIDCFYPFWIGLVIFLTRGGLFASLTWTTSFTFWILLFAVGQRRTQPVTRAVPSPVRT